MAIALLNPLISSVNGRLGNVVFYKRRNTQCIRSYVIPRNPDTAAQRAARHTFADAVKSWQSITRDEKFKFIRRARNMQMSGYNLYISLFIKKQESSERKASAALCPLNNNIFNSPIHSVSYSSFIQTEKNKAAISQASGSG